MIWRQPEVSGADWSLHVWQADDGLPNNNVTSLAQTPDGYLWVATSGHFARFDGTHFEEFAARSVIANYAGYTERGGALLAASNGALWMAMIHGPLLCLKAGTVRPFTNTLPDYVVIGMAEDAEGAVWLSYHGNVLCRVRNGEVTRLGERDGLPARYDCAIATDQNGRIWFGKDGQFGVFQNEHFTVLNNSFGRNMRLAGARDGGIWVCSGRELFKSDMLGHLQSKGYLSPDIPNANPTCMFEDQHGAVWIGTSDYGLFRYDDSGFENISTSHPYISSLLEDQEGDVWVGTGGGGLDRIRPRVFTLEGAAEGVPSGTVESICEDIHGSVWAVIQNGLLVCRTNGDWRVVSSATNWPGGKATCVASDGDGAVWIGTQNHALNCLRDGQFTTWHVKDGFLGHVVRGLLPVQNGDLWAVEDDPSIVQCIHKGHVQTFNLPAGIGVSRAICKDGAGAIWVGTSRGFLLKIHDDRVTDETTNVTGLATSIRTLAATPDGSLWIGYAGWGLGRYKDGHFARIASAQGLFNDDISEIVDDERGWLWFGSDRGIFKVRLRQLNEVEEGRATNVYSVHYGKGDALPSLQCSFGASPNVLHSHDDHLWFPTLTGLLVVNLNHIQKHLQPPKVLLKQVMVDDRVVASYGGNIPVPPGEMDLSKPQAELRVPPRHHRLDFDFTGLCLSVPENLHFQYQLAGYDDDWTGAGLLRSIDYSHLDAGNYHFMVRARNGDSLWSEADSITLVVLPFFWETWWFRLLAVATFTLAVIAVVRYVSFRRLRARLRLVEQQAALDKERSRIAKDIHDDLGGSLTQIKLLFELTQRNRAVPDKVSSLGQEGLAATRQIIKSMDEIVWAVNPRNDSLPHLIDYVGQFAIEFLAHADIRCRVNLPDHPVEWAVSPEARHNLFLAVKEALTNVIRHSGATEVWLHVMATEAILTIVIEDNGHGFENDTLDAFADGLSNMNQRMKDIGGQSRIESDAKRGTRVSLIFPKPNRT